MHSRHRGCIGRLNPRIGRRGVQLNGGRFGDGPVGGAFVASTNPYENVACFGDLLVFAVLIVRILSNLGGWCFCALRATTRSRICSDVVLPSDTSRVTL